MNPQQQAIMKVLPFMLPVFSFTMPAALVVYFLVSNTFRVFQQMFITRRFYSGSEDGPEIVRPVAADKATDDAGSRRTQVAGSGVNHGSRRPVKNPPKKRTRKPASGGSTMASGSKKSQGETPTRSQSKRVTPKKDQDEQNSGSRRRDKKR
jgi:YidC/Oxa1 family membrane protein insertase